MQSTADKLLEQRRKQEELNQLTKEEAEELKKAAKAVFSTREGIKVAKFMMKASGIYRPNKNLSNPYEMGAERGKEYMYLILIKGLLNPELIAEIEKKED